MIIKYTKLAHKDILFFGTSAAISSQSLEVGLSVMWQIYDYIYGVIQQTPRIGRQINTAPEIRKACDH